MILSDVQSELDERGIGVDEVGVCGLRYPVSVLDREEGKQDTVATFSMSVALHHERKGSHLSRFVEILDSCASELTPQTVPRILAVIQDRLDSTSAWLKVEFPYFVRRFAPITGASALTDYACGLTASLRDGRTRVVISARVPVTSVCPCSKAISDYGAHNQRGYLTIAADLAIDEDGEAAPMWLEDLIEAAEGSASSAVFPLLKRPDERHVTMLGYDRPVFVEDMVRGVADRLRDDARVAGFSVEAINDESIHNHAAFARLVWPPAGSGVSDPW